MASARHSKPNSTKLRFWRVSIPGGKRPEYVGLVEAPDQQSAEAAAVKQFRLSDEDRKRLVVRTETSCQQMREDRNFAVDTPMRPCPADV